MQYTITSWSEARPGLMFRRKTPSMNSCRACGLRLLFLLIFGALARVSGQTPSPAGGATPPLSLVPTRTPLPMPAPAQSPASPDESVKFAQEVALESAAAKVVNQIQDEEQGLYRSLSYLEKPERLDPGSFASLDDVEAWKKSLGEIKEKGDRIAALYANVAKDLEIELGSAKIDSQMLAQFKAAMLGGFPWEEINRKNQLFHEYIDEHARLLGFFEKNFGSWKEHPAKEPQFSSPQLTATYEKLRSEIVATGQKLEHEYKSISE